MVSTFVTFPYATYQNEPALLMGLSTDKDGKVSAVISITTNGEMKVVGVEQVKIDVDRLRKLPR